LLPRSVGGGLSLKIPPAMKSYPLFYYPFFFYVSNTEIRLEGKRTKMAGVYNFGSGTKSTLSHTDGHTVRSLMSYKVMSELSFN
jgi:hypothetical protein